MVNGDAQRITVAGDVQETVVSGLEPGKSAKVRVQAHNSVGDGPFSAVASATTASLPPPPPALEEMSSTHASLKVRWVQHDKADGVVETQLEMKRKGEWVRIFAGRSKSHKLTKLAADTTYSFRVRDVNHVGPGPYSDPVTFCTGKPPMAALPAPAVSLDAEDVAVVALRPPRQGEETELQCRQSGGPSQGERVAVRLSDAAAPRACTVTNEFAEVHTGVAETIRVGPLTPGASYEFRVRRRLDAQKGTFSTATSVEVAPELESEEEAEEALAASSVPATATKAQGPPRGLMLFLAVLTVVVSIVIYAFYNQQ